MANILKFRKKNSGNPLNELIKRALVLKKSLQNDKVIIVNGEKGMEKYFEAKISDVLFRKKIFQEATFLCGIYIAKMLVRMVKTPASFYVIDYIDHESIKRGSHLLQDGADMCFVMTLYFEDWCSRKTMSIDYYQDMGASLYYHFFLKTDSEIGYHMSDQFMLMNEVVKEAIGNAE